MALGRHLAALKRLRINHRHMIAGSLLAALAMPFSPASATPIHMMQSETILFAAITKSMTACSVASATAVSKAAPDMSKASAILGGQGSALERMRLRQQGAALAPSPFQASAIPAPSAGPQPLRLGLALPGQSGCNMAVVSVKPTTLPGTPTSVAAPARRSVNFLTARLETSKTPFDAQWQRVATLPRKTMNNHAARSGAKGANRSSIQAINTYVNRHVRYVDDRVLYKKADYWASASETLRRGAGDCEDYAIAKMQLLKKAGFAPDQMQLSVVRDLARNADHAVLLVMLGDETVILDNMSDTLVNAHETQDYRPIMSFSATKKWLHGFSTAVRN